MAYFVREKNRFLRLLNLEQKRSESLLLNILPREIAAIWKKEQRVIADQYESASILFADMAGFAACEKDAQRNAKYDRLAAAEDRFRQAIATGKKLYDKDLLTE